MASMAKITVIGNVTRDAELRMTPNGKAVAEFSVAVNGGKRDTPSAWVNFYRVSIFGAMADVAQQYVRKGGSIAVTGDLHSRTYTDKGGVEKTSLDIQYASFTLLGSRQDAAPAEAPRPATFDPDEIPF